MCSICILASRNYFGCQAARLIACHSLLSETATSGRCSFRDNLNFHFSDTGLSSTARDKTESGELLVPVRLFRSQRANTSWVGRRTIIRTVVDKYLLWRCRGGERMKKRKRRLRFPESTSLSLNTRTHVGRRTLTSIAINK